MQFYRIHSPQLWGDYGHILINGMTAHLPDIDGILQLERTGPQLPPITFPGLSDVLISSTLRQSLDQSALGAFDYQEVHKARIVNLDWPSWDLDSDMPPIRPDSGEPEDYILDRPHCESCADALGHVWQLMLRDGAVVDDDSPQGLRVHGETWNGDNIFYGKKPSAFFGRWILVSETAKTWLTQSFSEWVEFEKLPTK